MGAGKTILIRSIAVLQRAVFADIPVIPMRTTASRTAVGAITATRSIAARNHARPAPPATMSMLTILTPMASGRV